MSDLQRMRLIRMGGLFLLVAATSFMPTLAAAMSPDQTWMAGIYDAADLDDLVTLISDLCASGSGLSHEFSLPPCSPKERLDPKYWEYGMFDSCSSVRGPPRDLSPQAILSISARLTASSSLRCPIPIQHLSYKTPTYARDASRPPRWRMR